MEDPTLASLVIDQWSTHTGKWIVPIDKKRVLAVYDHIYDGKPSIMLREYKKQKGWQVVGYLTIEKPAAIELGKHITALRA